jgi:hypothetical protein
MPVDPKETSDQQRQAAPRQRVVLLGASNLIRGISTVIETAEHVWGRPLDVMAACGHGRSYGLTSCVLGRSLPAIVKCGLWEDLARREPVPTAALVTDVGNDILYGANINQIAAWVEQCLEHLAPVCKRVTVTGLPVEPIAALPPLRFRLVRSMLFPRSQLAFQKALRYAQELDTQLADLSAKYDAAFVAPLPEWYGWDPIHVRLRNWSRAWHTMLSTWCDDTRKPVAQGSFLRWLKLRGQRPLYRKLFCFEQRRAQPTCTLRNGTIVSFY